MNIADWYGKADLFVLSSRSEGFPNALTEAMAYGLPAVSFDCDTGPRDIIRNEIDGLLVKPLDRDGLKAALQRLMAEPMTRKEFAAHALSVRQRFALPRVADMWSALFRDLRE
jgi:glycosyltransferase involved in cell wall biosynthesis